MKSSFKVKVSVIGLGYVELPAIELKDVELLVLMSLQKEYNS